MLNNAALKELMAKTTVSVNDGLSERKPDMSPPKLAAKGFGKPWEKSALNRFSAILYMPIGVGSGPWPPYTPKSL